MQLQAAPEATPRIDAHIEEGVALAAKGKTESAGVVETIGQRLARLRRERGMTQVEMAERLGVAQPVVSDYERGELRLHGQLIVKLTQILSVSSEELLGLEAPRARSTATDRRFLRRLQEIEHLPRRDQQALLRTIDSFLKAARLA